MWKGVGGGIRPWNSNIAYRRFEVYKTFLCVFYEQFYGFHALRTVGKCTSRHCFRYGGLVSQTVRPSANHPFLPLASQLINQTVYPSVYEPLIHLASQLISRTVRRSFNQPFIPLSSQLINQTVSLSVYQPFIQLPNQFINKSVIQTLSHSFSQLICLGNFCTQCKDTISSLTKIFQYSLVKFWIQLLVM